MRWRQHSGAGWVVHSPVLVACLEAAAEWRGARGVGSRDPWMVDCCWGQGWRREGAAGEFVGEGVGQLKA